MDRAIMLAQVAVGSPSMSVLLITMFWLLSALIGLTGIAVSDTTDRKMHPMHYAWYIWATFSMIMLALGFWVR